MALTILLIEPEARLRESVRAALREEGHLLWTFSSAGGALAASEELNANLALLTSGDDPDMDRLVERLRRPGVRCQVVWIAPPGRNEVEALVEKRRPRGLLSRSNLVDEAVLLSRRVEQTNVRSRALHTAPPMVGESPAMLGVRDLIGKIAEGGAPTVLITGESGTGKEVVARRLHALGPRADGPFVEVDCAAIPATLLESELFGHEAGTFTDARESKVGLMELAQGGTVFLDEIGEMEFAVQAKLLRVLDSRRLRRLGGREEVPLDVHLVAATNRHLEDEVRDGRFRADLFYRLDVVRIELPPLRVRNGDVARLAERFLEDSCRRIGRSPLVFSPEALTELTAYTWPGNVRELRNHVERLALLAPADAEAVESGGLAGTAGDPSSPPIRIDFSRGPILWEEIERTVLSEALEAADGNVSEAARLLGLGRGALRYRLARYDLEAPPEERRRAA